MSKVFALFSNLKTKPKILIGVCTPLVFLVILGLSSFFGVHKINDTAGWVYHTYKVLGKADNIVAAAVDMETGMRGYLLAGQEQFLDPYKGGEKAVYERIADLKQTVSDNPGQMARLY
jgi:methyl-accepting chemotaxis protein